MVLQPGHNPPTHSPPAGIYLTRSGNYSNNNNHNDKINDNDDDDDNDFN